MLVIEVGALVASCIHMGNLSVFKRIHSPFWSGRKHKAVDSYKRNLNFADASAKLMINQCPLSTVVIKLSLFIKFKRELVGDFVIPQTATTSSLENDSEKPN